MNTQTNDFICFDRRKNPRREPRGLRSYSSGYEPNAFSRRNGMERRDTIVVYREHKYAS